MPGEDKKRAALQALVARVRDGAGTTSSELRASAFTGTGIPPPLQELIGKVAASPALVTEADFAAAQASGFSEDQIFELVICAALGQSARMYEAGLAALADATGNGEAG